jgi:hypothetical protein
MGSVGGPDVQSHLELVGAHELFESGKGKAVLGEHSELPEGQPVQRLPAVPPNPLPSQTANHDASVSGDGVVEIPNPGKNECQINTAYSASALYLPGKVEGHSVRYLVDSGCTLNLLAKRVFDKFPVRVRNCLEPYQCSAGTLADGSALPFLGQVELAGRLRSESVQIDFVVAEIKPDAILGIPFLQDNHCQLACAESALIFNGKSLHCTDSNGVDFVSKVQVIANVSVPPLTEKLIGCRLVNRICSHMGMVEGCGATTSRGIVLAASVHACGTDGGLTVRCVNPTSHIIELPAGSVIGCCTSIEDEQMVEEVQVNSVSGEGCSQAKIESESEAQPAPGHLGTLYQEATAACSQLQERQAIARLLNQYADVFSSGEHDMGLTNLVKHSISLVPGARPVKQAPRRLGAEKEAEVDKQIQKLRNQDLIEPAFGAWSSPVVLVKKKDGSWRFCIDYRRLNAVTLHDAYPLPRIDESLEALAGNRYFSTLDLMSGYWQVPLDSDAKDKTAFCTRGGLWRWKVLPFGLTTAPATFQRLMERVLHGLHWKSLLLYLDDVIVIGKSFNEHYAHLEEVLTRLRAAGLKLKPSKCHLFQREVRYLGHVVSKHGVSTDPDKIAAVADWPVPRNLLELRAFLGTVGYYRQYVEDFANKARPLTKLTAKNVMFQWTDECQSAFDALKQSLLTAPVLGYPDPTLSYVLDTDASLAGVGAVLSQVQGGKERVISYYSRALSQPERNYCVTRRELLAVVKAIIHFRPYLYGKEFKIRTDHASLLWLCRRTMPSAQVARWLEILSEFNFSIEHRAGVKHGNADGLSRRPCHDCKQCARVARLCGGPSKDEIIRELDTKAQLGEQVCTRVAGEQLRMRKITMLPQVPGNHAQG